MSLQKLPTRNQFAISWGCTCVLGITNPMPNWCGLHLLHLPLRTTSFWVYHVRLFLGLSSCNLLFGSVIIGRGLKFLKGWKEANSDTIYKHSAQNQLAISGEVQHVYKGNHIPNQCGITSLVVDMIFNPQISMLWQLAYLGITLNRVIILKKNCMISTLLFQISISNILLFGSYLSVIKDYKIVREGGPPINREDIFCQIIISPWLGLTLQMR